jgi:hypothetical protein
MAQARKESRLGCLRDDAVVTSPHVALTADLSAIR